MTKATINITIRMDNKLKYVAEKLVNKLGMNLSTAFNIFVHQSLRERGIPFVISFDIPSSVNHSDINEAENLINNNDYGEFSDVDELLSNLNN